MTDYALNEWASTEDYLVRVEEVKEEMVLDGGLKRKTEVRSVRILVAYQNKKNLLLKHVTLQWLLYDTDGYNYGSQLTRYFYGDDAPRKLQEGYIGLGKQVRGWVAFKVPQDAVLDYVQFRSNYMSDKAVTISLEKQPTPFEAEPKISTDQNFFEKVWQTVKPKSADPDFLLLEPTAVYRFKKPVIDFYGNTFSPGDELTYNGRYPAYQGLHILLFVETTLYLHEDSHADLLAEWDRFIERV